jgi:hypothetical protein
MTTTTTHDHSQSAFLTQHKDVGDQQTNTHISIIYMMKYKYNIIVIFKNIIVICIYIKLKVGCPNLERKKVWRTYYINMNV